jgi:hypothetical protein
MRIATFATIAAIAIMSVVFAGTAGPSPVPSPPGYTMNTSALTVCRGTTNYIPVSIANLGKTSVASMQNVQVGFANSQNIHGTTISAGTLNAGQTKMVEVPLFVNANSSTLIQTALTINYYYYSLYTDSESQNITLEAQSCPLPLSIKLSPTILSAGTIQNLTLTFTNSGSSPINSIVTYLSLPSSDAAILTSQPIEISRIEPDSTASVNASIFVYTSASPAFGMNVTSNYYAGNSLGQSALMVGALSTGLINMTYSSVAISPSTPSAGSVFSISFILTNVGTSSAAAVTATEMPPSGFSAFSSSSTFVGDIAADTQSPVTLTLTANSTIKPGSYTIPISLDYLNSLRQPVSKTIYVPVQIASASALNSTALHQNRGSGAGLFDLVLILVIIALVVLLYMERKKTRRHLNERR